MNRPEQQALLTDLLTKARQAGLVIRWASDDIVVIGLPQVHVPTPENNTPQAHNNGGSQDVSAGQEGRQHQGTNKGQGLGEDASGSSQAVEQA